MKAIILSLSKSYFNLTKTKNYKDSKKSYPKKITKAILHNLLNTMINDDNSKNNNKSSNESSYEESKATLLVNTATCKNIFPTNIRKLLPVPEKKKPPNQSKSDKKIIVLGHL